MNSFFVDYFVQELKNESCLIKVSKVLESLISHIVDKPAELKTSSLENSFQMLLCSVAQAGVVRDFAVDNSIGYEEANFKYLPETAELSFKCLNLLCQKNISEDHPLPSHAALVSILILCGAHHQKFLWTNPRCILGSNELSSVLCKVLNKETICDVLIHRSKNGPTVVKGILEHLKGSLNKENWRKNPCTRHVYKWVLFHLKHSELPDLLPDILPPALLFVDDHESENKLLGIMCMHHIIKNTPPTVLSWQGRSDVVYHALHHLVYTHEPEVICALHPCLLDLLAGMEPDPNSANRSLKNCRYDDLFSNLLSSMSMEQKIKLRNAYATQLPLYIDKMGITVLSHNKKLFDVVHEYLSVYDGPSENSRLSVLLGLQLIIKVAWPRLSIHCGHLLKCLLRLLYDLNFNPHDISDAVKNEVILKIKDCLILLNMACPDTFQDQTSEIIKLQGVAEPVVEMLKDFLNKEMKNR